jgi:hypothetical protein
MFSSSVSPVLKRKQHQGLDRGVTGADLLWLALMPPALPFKKLGLILTEFEEPGKTARQETRNSGAPLWVPRNTDGFGQADEFPS